jgi:hypothetical protein
MVWYQRVPTFYLVRLLGIAVNGQLLNVTSSAFASGAVLDSRMAVTRLLQTAYQALCKAFRGREKDRPHHRILPPLLLPRLGF